MQTRQSGIHRSVYSIISLNTMVSEDTTNESEKKLKNVEEEVQSLKNELIICQEAKTTSEVCSEIISYVQKEGNEPFSTEPVIQQQMEGESNIEASKEAKENQQQTTSTQNKWHKSQSSGGGCIIL